MELETPAAAANLPVLRVTPKTITAETAKQVAKALFGDSDIFEFSGTRTRAELEAQILSLRQLLADRDTMEERFGPAKDDVAVQIEAVLAGYEEEYAAAPESAEYNLCSWKFHPKSWYVENGAIAEDQSLPVIKEPSMIGFEEMTFTFGKDGNLVRFELQSPMDVAETVNASAAILPFEAAMEAAKNRLQMTTLTTDPYALERFYSMVMFYPTASMTVYVNQAELGY